jgi:predicted anti-sigma-YlaC factor YlaD
MMREFHLQETELACADIGAAVDVTEHLRWCARCRSTAAEYHWLGERIGDTLAATADRVIVPRPRWRVVKRRMADGQKRRLAGWRASATAGIALAICAMLSLSSVAGAAVATQTAFPEAVMTPPSATTSISGAHTVSGATPTPIASREGVESLSTLTLPLIPTPPKPDI